MGFLIYKHTLMAECEHKGGSYIGQTCQKLYKRVQNGKGYCAGHQYAFENAIKKYGGSAFKTEILESGIATQAEANEREIYGIAYYHTYMHDPNCAGYNLTKGGNSYCAKKVVCLETEEIFSSIAEAAEIKHVSAGQISRQLNAHINTNTNRVVRKGHGAEIEDTANIKELIKQAKEKYYIIECIETGTKYFSILEAARANATTANQITHCLIEPEKCKTAGHKHGRLCK